MAHNNPALSKTTVRVFVTGNGTCTADCHVTAEKRANLKTRGFSEIACFTVPSRAMIRGKGWTPYYRYWLGWAIHNLGI